MMLKMHDAAETSLDALEKKYRCRATNWHWTFSDEAKAMRASIRAIRNTVEKYERRMNGDCDQPDEPGDIEAHQHLAKV